MTMDLKKICKDSGIGETVADLLEYRGVTNVHQLYHLFEQTANIDSFLGPLTTGLKVDLGGTEKELKLEATPMMVQKAAVQAAVDTIRAIKLSAGTATPGAPAAPAGAAASTSNEDKVPKTLPSGYWRARIKEYNDITVDSRPREFPDKLLVGAEVVLARMVHEHKETQMYTPPTLMEIISRRSFTSTGEPNPWQMKASDPDRTLFPSDEGTLIERKKKEPEALSLGVLLDGITTAKWAFIFAHWGGEPECEAWCEWWIKLSKDNPNKNWHIRSFWVSAHYRVTSAMRQGQSFQAATTEIMQSNLKTEALAKTPPPPQTVKGGKRKSQYDNDWSPPKRTRKGGGKGGKTKPNSDRQRNGNNRPQDQPCHYFSQGKCNRGDKCPYSHSIPAPPPTGTSNYYFGGGKGRGGKNGKGGKHGKGKDS